MLLEGHHLQQRLVVSLNIHILTVFTYFFYDIYVLSREHYGSQSAGYLSIAQHIQFGFQSTNFRIISCATESVKSILRFAQAARACDVRALPFHPWAVFVQHIG